ncbi:MAG: hypothetical protein HWE30_03255 [Methylocystaceae bacterium]|nr:hypothetical protein [Methylocystaceae bacterium]
MTETVNSDVKVRMFRPELRAASDELKAVCKIAEQEITTKENRKRARRADDQKLFEQRVDAIICNALHAYLSTEYDYCAPPRSRWHTVASRYKSDLITKTFPKVLDAMEEVGFIVLKQPENKYHRQRLYPSEKLIQLTDEFALSFSDFTICSDELETVVLLTKDKTKQQEDGGAIPKKFKEYEDTPQTTRMRDEITIINNHLKSFDLHLEGNPGFDFSNTHLVRRFNDSFDGTDFSGGGRLFGGPWQNLKKELRRDALRINGSRIAEVDFDQMMPSLMYALNGIEPPKEDAYDVGYDRKPIKVLFNAMTFRRRMRNFPYGLEDAFGEGTKIADVKKAIFNRHKPIKPLFDKQLGHKLQRMESDILVSVLLLLADFNCPCLPLHDAILCRDEDKDKVLFAMEREAFSLTGYNIGVSIDYQQHS